MDQLFPGTDSGFGFRPVQEHYDHHNRGPELIAVNSVFVALSLIFVFIRLWTRARLTKKLFPEDYVIVISWLLAFASAFVCSWSTKQYVGARYYDIPSTFYFTSYSFPANYVNGQIYWVAIMVVKISILMLYLRLTPSLRWRYWVFGTMVFIITSSVAMGLVTTMPCINPVRASWDLSARTYAKCVNYPKVLTAQAIFHVVGDLVILFLPMPILWRSSMPRMKKIHVSVVLSLGGAVSIVSIVRLQVVHEIHQPSGLQDYNYEAVKLLILSTVELNVGIICSCLPATKQLLAKWFPNVFASYSTPTPVLYDGEKIESGGSGGVEGQGGERKVRSSGGGSGGSSSRSLRKYTSTNEMNETVDIEVYP